MARTSGAKHLVENVPRWEDAVAAFSRGNYPMTLKLLRPLVDQGDAKGQHSLAFMYEHGLGVGKNVHLHEIFGNQVGQALPAIRFRNLLAANNPEMAEGREKGCAEAIEWILGHRPNSR